VHGLSSGRHRRASSAGTGKLVLTLVLGVCVSEVIAGAAVVSTASAASAAPMAAVARTPAVTAAARTPALTAAARTPAVTPRVRGTANKRTIRRGSAVKVTARVVNPRTGRAVRGGHVRLQAWRRHAWRTWQTKRLTRSGKVVFSSHPHRTGTFRTVFTGTSGVRSRTGNHIRVRVRYSGGSRVLAEARRHVGAWYQFGAAGPYRFDCSGFTQYVFRKAAGRRLPHQANLQQRYGRAVSKSHRQGGDLIVFRSGSYGYHVGIYAGGGYMYDAPHTGARVGRHKIWSSHYVVRRLV
jgi:cell wall-associated NlpC family hydrolase